MSEDLRQPPEAALIERLRLGKGKKDGAVSRVAKAAGISEGRWRQLAKGYQQATPDTRLRSIAPADTLARMARAVGATPAQLREAGRDDAASILEKPSPLAIPSESVAPQPDQPQESPQEGIVRYGTLLWDAVVEVADAAQGTSLEGLAEHAVVIAADVLPELILGLNPGPAARPLIESAVRRGPVAVERVNHFNQLNQGDTHDMEAAQKSDASSEAVEDQEAALPEGVEVDDDGPLRIDEFTVPDDRHENHQDATELGDAPRRRRGNSERGSDTAP